MKRVHRTWMLLALVAGVAGARAADEPVRQVRVALQLIEMPMPALGEVLAGKDASGPAVHARAMELVKAGTAKVLETAMVTTRSGQRATIESIREVIYPTEYEPPELPAFFPQPPPGQQPVPGLQTPFPVGPHLRAFDSICAFETRNAGLTFEIEPTMDAEGKIIDLRLAPEFVQQVDLLNWCEHRDEWGDASLRMPIFETWRTNTAVTLINGQFELVSVFTPRPADPVPGQIRKILVFVRADVVTVRGK